jgi:hypothetical protein
MDGRRPAQAGAQNPAYRPTRPPPSGNAIPGVSRVESGPAATFYDDADYGSEYRGSCYLFRLVITAAGGEGSRSHRPAVCSSSLAGGLLAGDGQRLIIGAPWLQVVAAPSPNGSLIMLFSRFYTVGAENASC